MTILSRDCLEDYRISRVARLIFAYLSDLWLMEVAVIRATKILLFGLPIFVMALAACSDEADESAGPSTTVAESEPTAAAEESIIAAPSIQIGEISLTWEVQEVGEGIKPAFAIDEEGVAHVTFLTEADHGAIMADCSMLKIAMAASKLRP